MARSLSEALECPLVDEYAREHLTGKPAYAPSDLLLIASEQARRERRLQDGGGARRKLCVADTDVQNIYIWWQEKYGPAPSSVISLYRAQAPRLYLLCRPDMPWEPDPLREAPHDRERLFERYADDLRSRGATFQILEGPHETRLSCARDAIAAIMSGREL